MRKRIEEIDDIHWLNLEDNRSDWQIMSNLRKNSFWRRKKKILVEPIEMRKKKFLILFIGENKTRNRSMRFNWICFVRSYGDELKKSIRFEGKRNSFHSEEFSMKFLVECRLRNKCPRIFGNEFRSTWIIEIIGNKYWFNRRKCWNNSWK